MGAIHPRSVSLGTVDLEAVKCKFRDTIHSGTVRRTQKDCRSPDNLGRNSGFRRKFFGAKKEIIKVYNLNFVTIFLGEEEIS